MRSLLFILFLFITACEAPEESPVQLTMQPAVFADLPGWEADNLAEIVPAFEKSCARILKVVPEKPFGPLEAAGTYGDWQPLCEQFTALENKTAPALRSFFETYFRPWSIRADAEPEGLFTGYYEASLHGSRTKSGPYTAPLHARPNDLVMVQLGDFREHLKGERIAGRVIGGNLKPYEERADIVAGAWPHNDKTLVWVDSPVDAFFVQIQGSGIVELPDGQAMRIGYAGQNGHVYYAIGRELIKRGHLTKENVSMQAIRDWLQNNPGEADEIMNTNRSYVFFQELTGEGPLGGEGVALTPERSLAVDRSLISYGLPLWIDIEMTDVCEAVIARNEKTKQSMDRRVGLQPPRDDVCKNKALRLLMIAQDTGGAIRGPVRGDVFWGYGPRAETLAGHMKSKGRYWALLPKK